MESMMSSSPPSSSLCFREAISAWRDGSISNKEYLVHLLRHFQDTRHPDDDRNYLFLGRDNPFASLIRKLAIEDQIKIQDISPYVQLFEDCMNGAPRAVSADLDALQQTKPTAMPEVMQVTAVLAAERGQAEILQFCLDNGAIFEWHLDEAALKGALNSSRILDVLWSSNWRNIQTSQNALDDLLSQSLWVDNEIMMDWLFEHGAKVAPSVARKAAYDVRIAKLAAILTRGNIDMFIGSGALQHAAGRGDLAKVKLLVESGADIEELPPSRDIREPGPFRALYEAVKNNRALVAKYLLENGARRDMPGASHLDTPLRLAKRRNDALMLEVFGLEPPTEEEIESGMFLERLRWP